MATSDPQSCYVYIQLPGTQEIVTCGRYGLDRDKEDVVYGRFVYRHSYLRHPRAVEIDKHELTLSAETFQTSRLRGIFGALRDSSPDAWGRRVIEARLRGTLSEVGYLLNSPEDRIGALSFGLNTEPPPPVRRFNRVLQLPLLLAAAERLMRDEGPETVNPDVRRQIDDLIQPGTSMGGARPKNVVEDEDGLWLAKFPTKEDRWNYSAVEAAMLNLARACGIRAALPKVVKVARQDVLLVKRFDREKLTDGYLRHRMVSALTVLRADDNVTGRADWSYLKLADEIRRWAQDPDRDLEELFRRIVFNALISNLDDHPRNHALIAPGANWLLSPAYDLTPAPVTSAEQRDLALTVGAYGRYANRENLLSECVRFRLTRERASAMIDDMKIIIGLRWREFVLKAGGTNLDCTRIEGAFIYPGFEYEPRTEEESRT